MCMNKKILTKHDVPACIPCRKGVGGCLLLSSLLTLLSFFSSCSNISEDERYIYVKPADVNRCVLVETSRDNGALTVPVLLTRYTVCRNNTVMMW